MSGIPLAVKFGLAIGVTIAVLVVVWGLVIGSVTESALMGQVKRDGVQGVKILASLGDELLKDFYARGEYEGWETVKLARLRSFLPGTGPSTDIVDAWILSRDGFQIASARGGNQVSFTTKLNFAVDVDVAIRRGQARLDNRSVPALSFDLPIGGKHPGRAILILSYDRIKAQVRDLWTKMFGAGIFFLVIGVGVSFMLAGTVTSPIKGLVNDMDVVARGNLNHSTRATTGDEIGLLANAFNRMVRTLREGREAEKRMEVVESELNAAQEVQANLLPPRIPSIPGYDIFPHYLSAKEVGGDYYDFIPVDKTHLGFIVADVSGKGIPGSMVMYGTRTILRMMAPDNGSAVDTLKKVNYWVAQDIKRGMFVTALYCILDVRTRELSVCSAGHNPMFLYRERTGQVEEINPHGIALGFDPGPIFNRTAKEQKVQLQKGDRVVLYTDGVVECMDEAHEEFTEERLVRFVKENARMSSKDFVRYLTRVLEEHQGKAEQHDDITIVTFRAD